MKNRGFTLIELLAVILILAIIALITTPTILNVIDDTKHKSNKVSIQSYAKALAIAVTEYTSNNVVYPSGSYIQSEKGKTLTNKENPNIVLDVNFDGGNVECSTIEIFKSGVWYLKDCSVNGTLVEGYVATNKKSVCIKETGDKNTPGSEYVCEVKPGVLYNFYVLSTEADGTTNLIMDRNINSDGTPVTKGIEYREKNVNGGIYNFVEWNSSSVNKGGPVTAMQFLYDATKTWTNIPPLNYTYYDRTYQNITASRGYNSFISSNGIAKITPLTGSTTKIGTTSAPLRARLPIYSGTWFESGVSKSSEKGEVLDKKIDNSNQYLYENLDFNDKSNCSYWTLSSYYKNDTSAWRVNKNGQVLNASVRTDDAYGVRPVINIKL